MFAIYEHNTGVLGRVIVGQPRLATLNPGEWELLTLVPIEDGFAALGLADKLNSRGAVATELRQADRVVVALRDGGRFVALAERQVTKVECDGLELPFDYQAAAQRLDVTVPTEGSRRLVVHLAPMLG